LSRVQFVLVNREVRQTDQSGMGLEIFFNGERHFITADRLQILNLLLSTYEAAMQRNKELAAVNRELEAANKELDAFSHSVSHDLRAPLRSIDGFTNSVLQEFSPQLPPEAQRLLKNVSSSAREMGQLIEGLLRLSRLGRRALSRRTIDLPALVHEALEQLRKQEVERHIDVRVGQLPDCIGDPSLLKHVVVNLLSNAFKFTRQKQQAVVEVGCQQQNGERIYYVRDNGAGFDMHYVKKLFGVFQRLHSAEDFEGTGVGLSIVQRIILRHGGRIWAEAAVDKGATFYFTLPD
jgi:light-regulated signal transduction histidine kinase (bacteriophytochrome)